MVPLWIGFKPRGGKEASEKATGEKKVRDWQFD